MRGPDAESPSWEIDGEGSRSETRRMERCSCVELFFVYIFVDVFFGCAFMDYRAMVGTMENLFPMSLSEGVGLDCQEPLVVEIGKSRYSVCYFAQANKHLFCL